MVLAAACSARAQNEPRKLAPEVEDLIGKARGAPPEFAADVLLRIAQSGRVPDRARKIELIEEAFRQAANAQNRVRRRAIHSSAIDTRAGYLSDAFDLALDGLSLQARAVKALLKLDARKARQLLGEVPPLELPPLTCEDALVYMVSDFYEVVGEVAQTAFTPAEIEREEHVRFLEAYVAAMSSPVQIGGLVRAVVAQNLEPAQLELLMHAFSLALHRMADDDRSFWATWWADGFARLEELALACRRNRIPTIALQQAARNCLLNHYRGRVCAESVTEHAGENPYPRNLDEINSVLRVLGDVREAGAGTIAVEDAKPAAVEGGVKAEKYWQSVDSKNLLALVRKLQKTPRVRNEVEWQQAYEELMRGMDAWSPSSEASELDYFHQKCVLFKGLTQTLPWGKHRANALQDLVNFLAQSDIRHENRIEWFLHANYAINMLRSGKKEDRAEATAALASSRNPVFSLYLDVEAR